MAIVLKTSISGSIVPLCNITGSRVWSMVDSNMGYYMSRQDVRIWESWKSVVITYKLHLSFALS